MKKNHALLKQNTLFVTTLALFLASIVFAGITIYSLTVSSQNSHLAVGDIYLGNVDPANYETILSQKVNLWKSDADFRIYYDDTELILDLSIFKFDALATVSALQNQSENRAYFTLDSTDEAALLASITATFTALVTDELEFDAFLAGVNDNLEGLVDRQSFYLEDYLAPELVTTILLEATVAGIPESDVTEILDIATSIVIPAGERFSLLETFAPFELRNELLSIIASGMLRVSMATGFTGFVFQQYPEVPTWATIGSNVRILQTNGLDFSFFNRSHFDYTVTLEQTGATLIRFRLLGYPSVATRAVEIQSTLAIPYATIYVDDETIGPATLGVVVTETDTEFIYHLTTQAGVDGQIWTISRTTTFSGADPTEENLFYEQYLPINEIIHEHIVVKGG